MNSLVETTVGGGVGARWDRAAALFKLVRQLPFSCSNALKQTFGRRASDSRNSPGARYLNPPLPFGRTAVLSLNFVDTCT